MSNRQTIFFLGGLFLGLLILGMLYVSNFRNTFEGMDSKPTDVSNNKVTAKNLVNNVMTMAGASSVSPTPATNSNHVSAH